MSKSLKTISILALFFGWLLSFPLYGPILQDLRLSGLNTESMGLTFTFLHALGLLTGIFLKQRYWQLLMKVGSSVTFLASIIFVLANPSFYILLCGILGFFAALVVIGWSYLFSNVCKSNHLSQMTLIILAANLFLAGITIMADYLPSPAVYVIVNIPLAIATVLIFTILPSGPEKLLKNSAAATTIFPKKLLFYLCLAIFGLFLSGGFMYNGILPFYQKTLLWNCFPELIYIVTLMTIWKTAPQKELISLVYYSVSLLGLGFIAFMALKNQTVSFFLTTAFVFSALAFLDVFLWTILGTISEVCQQPLRVFGLGLAVNLLALYSGGIIARHFSARFEHYLFLMSMVALAAMYLVILIIPLLNRLFLDAIKNKLAGPAALAAPAESPAFNLKTVVPEMNLLTPKETEIIQYIIEGASNKEIAAQLYISENTLKVHLKNITRKFGVSGKYELLSFILNAISSHTAFSNDGFSSINN
jgi:DNA-binding CsgD family transcriptional regulator